MAINEHKNLNDANLHVPKGFEAASNDSIMTKNSGGALEWITKLNIKTDTITLRGYCAPTNTNYWYPEPFTSANKQNKFDTDYTAATIDNATVISVSSMVRCAIFVAPADCTILNINGWVTGTDTETVTFALCKGSNVAVNDADEFQVGAALNTLVVLDEFTASTYGANTKMGAIDENAFTVNTMSKGDFLLPMIKSVSGGNDTYFNMSIELGYTN
jgi:hypothetical protein